MTVEFGPSGNSQSFYDEGYKSSIDYPMWLKRVGLDAYEYSFGRGINLKEETAFKIGENAKRFNIKLSIHAPYYINFGSLDDDTINKSIDYLRKSSKLAKIMGADRVVFHPGSCAKIDRKTAFERCKYGVSKAIETLYKEDLFPYVIICPETMGKQNQLGTLDEIIELCNIDYNLIPTIDFGHIHALGRGALNSISDFEYIFDKLFSGLGEKCLKKLHCHFSRIEYTDAGEKKHWSLSDTDYGPEFSLLAKVLIKKDVYARIICESRENMAEDALELKRIFQMELNSLKI
ncbi:putative endonuclease 4 [Caloramator mitchellensis]|uniref:Putative endonuclease 4 n=1 Tax=Caloramator mitchellensis TaxID=908809 RepID=A0A0R3JTJ2_CALMK|nr:TIM barrel protein [Caloramator mitchellensis]KRQ86848.1 putative endonuclease 4 [Caloramator mitchellensis]